MYRPRSDSGLHVFYGGCAASSEEVLVASHSDEILSNATKDPLKVHIVFNEEPLKRFSRLLRRGNHLRDFNDFYLKVKSRI